MGLVSRCWPCSDLVLTVCRFTLLITTISILFIYLWTGIYTQFTVSFTWYQAAQETYGAASFWAGNFFCIALALLPRFAYDAIQKAYFPSDVDIVREQVRQGKFDYLKDVDPLMVSSQKKVDSTASSETSGKTTHLKRGNSTAMSEDQRPIYPPSMAPTATTHNARSNNGSDGTDYIARSSIERGCPPVSASGTPLTPTIHEPNNPFSERPSFDRPRPSFDRMRTSMDRTRASFEASRDFTSAAYLARVESTSPQTPSQRHPLSIEDRLA